MAGLTPTQRQFARDLADPKWSLSVPGPAKDSIRQLLAAVEEVDQVIESLREAPSGSTSTEQVIERLTQAVGDPRSSQ